MTAPTAAPGPPESGSGPAVLVVEDDDGIATQLVRGLTTGGYSVQPLTTRAEALAHSVPDVVLLDLELPDGDGVTVCRKLRERSSVAIIVVTAYGENPTGLTHSTRARKTTWSSLSAWPSCKPESAPC